jgi:hypothetical protein
MLSNVFFIFTFMQILFNQIVMRQKLYFLNFFLFVQLASIAQTQIGSDINGEAASNVSGHCVSISADGNVVAIGSPYNNGNGYTSGHVRIYQNNSGVWTQVGSDIDGEAASDYSGYSVSLSNDGSVVAIGAIFNDGSGMNSGHVRVFRNILGTWVQIGTDINGDGVSHFFGSSVALNTDGTVMAIGASNNGDSYVKVFRNVSETWTQIGTNIVREVTGDRSGIVSISSDGNVVAIGASGNDGNGTDSGHVRVYRNISGVWTQVGGDIDGEAAGDQSGSSVSLSSDGSVLAIGASANDGNGTDSGHVRIYRNISGTWTQIGNDINGEAAGDNFGNSISLSANGLVVAVGAYVNDGNGTNSGHVRAFR